MFSSTENLLGTICVFTTESLRWLRWLRTCLSPPRHFRLDVQPTIMIVIIVMILLIKESGPAAPPWHCAPFAKVFWIKNEKKKKNLYQTLLLLCWAHGCSHFHVNDPKKKLFFLRRIFHFCVLSQTLFPSPVDCTTVPRPHPAAAAADCIIDANTVTRVRKWRLLWLTCVQHFIGEH